MFDSFTQRAVNAVMLAQEETQRLGHREVATTQLLLGLIREETGVAALVLRDAGINLENACLEVEKIQGRGEGYYGNVDFNQHTREVFDLSSAEAEQLKDSEIDTQHLLLGLLRQLEGGAVRVLQKLGVDPNELRNQVLLRLAEQGHPIAWQILYGTNPNKAHLALIDKILKNPEGSEAQFIRNNPGIIEPELIESVASILEKRGDAKGAEFLRGLLTPLSEKKPEATDNLPEGKITDPEQIQISILPEISVPVPEPVQLSDSPQNMEPIINVTAPTNQEMERFIFQLVRITFESQANEQVVFSFLRENLDKLNDRFPKVLQNWWLSRFTSLEQDQKLTLAKRILEISSLIRKFEGGSRAINMEIALTGYKTIVPVFTQAEYPEQWAITQNCLGLAYLEQVQGNREENLKQAIGYFMAALRYYNRDTFPQERKIILANFKRATDEIKNLSKHEEIKMIPPNPERIQAYFYLIEQLLRNPQNQHLIILDDSSELLDAGLIEMMKERAVAEKNKGNLQDAELLVAIAEQINETLPVPPASMESSLVQTKICSEDQPDVNSQEGVVTRGEQEVKNNNNEEQDENDDEENDNDPQLEFLWRALQITAESKGNPQFLYLLLQQNLDLLDDKLPQVLKDWANDALAKIEPEQVQNLATVIGMFSESIQQLPLGIASKQTKILKTALVGFEIVATVFTKEAFPERATQIQNYIRQTFVFLVFLQLSEIEASQGDIQSIYPLIEENLDKLDDNFAEFLRNWISSAIPVQQNLSFTNQSFLLQIVALSIFAFSKVMKDFYQGNQETNLEIAIAGYESITNIFNRDSFPIQWGEIQNQLGQAYLKHQRGDRALNLQQAIKCFLSSLKIFTPNEFPEERVIIEQNLTQAALEARQLVKESSDKFTPEELEAIYENFIESMLEGNITEELMSFLIANVTRVDLEYSSALMQKALKRKVEEWIANLPEDAQEERTEMLQKFSNAFSQDLALNFHYYQFFERIEQVMRENNNDFSALYSVLEDNLDKLNEPFILFLRGLDLRNNLSFDTFLAEETGKELSNFSFAMLGFPKGDHALNVEIAIAGSEKVLELFTRNSFPILWATQQRNLAEAYIFRVRGDKADNINRAIRHCENALEIINTDNFPDEWARIQGTLVSVQSELATLRGDRSQSIELAIEHYENVQKTLPSTAKLEDIIVNLNHLGNIYLERVRGTQEDNIETAISYFNKGIELITPETYQGYLIMLQGNLANAYRDRIKGRKSDNFKEAISRYETVLLLQEEKTFEWAVTLLNLGLTYWKLGGDKEESQEKAIDCYQKALTVYTQTNYSEDWGKLQNNLGVVYRHRIQGNADENMKLAIMHYQNALQARTPNDFPLYRAETLFSLGWAYQTLKQFADAYNACKEGIDLIESLRGQIVSGDEIKQKFAEEWNQIYRIMVDVCLELAVNDSQYYIKTIEYVERSKARNLFELLANRDVESKAIAQKIEFIPFQEILNSLDEKKAIVEWFFTDDCFYTFIITSTKPHVTVWKSSQKDFVELYNWANFYYQGYRENQEKENNWQKSLPNFLQNFSRILNLNHLINILPTSCDRLILIPHHFLHLLPLHALPLDDKNSLLDYFAGGVTYVPSCQIWYQIQHCQNPNFNYLFAVKNPTLDLQYTNIEVEVIKRFFENENVDMLENEKATKQNINSSRISIANCVHFSCHGYFKFDDPLKSALILAQSQVAEAQHLAITRYVSLREGDSFDLQKCLTLEEIFRLNLTECRLVTLSACETGLTDVKSISDEYIGLPSGFLYAGASNVVASLWTVNDLSTTFLMIKLYENLNQQLKEKNELNVPIALRDAQLWLKQVNKTQLEEWLANIPLTNLNHQAQLEDWLSDLEPNSQPFQSPYHWAGFCAIGQ